ncbi:MAG: DUF4349 domain-containing protein [Microscillaceae bacterium]|jgi:hypothetical protein|nr:DUF4349 domain-containing protein [Microscillaceae bacterium]
MKAKIKKGVLWVIAGFIGVFILRLGYGYIIYADGSPNMQNAQNHLINESMRWLTKSNYASDRYKAKELGSVYQAIDQKYEKIASLTAVSDQFAQDEAQIRQTVKQFNALIQFERKSGLPGNRFINLAIGVPPKGFDGMVEKIKQIGKLRDMSIDKIDKTNEFKQLNARRVSLEKTYKSLLSFKDRSGKIDELVNLEEKILAVEDSLQRLGVQLGDFDAENEFCTIKLSLRETGALTYSIPFLSRLKTALEWGLKYYTLFLFLLFLAVLGTWVAVKLAQSLHWLPSALINKLGDKT